jgi:hypothetical protein
MLTFLTFEASNRLLECKWFYNEIINGYLVLPTLFISRHFFEQYERLLFERNGPLFFQAIYSRIQYGVESTK